MAYQDLLVWSTVYFGCLNFCDAKLVLVIFTHHLLYSELGSAHQNSHCPVYFSQQRTIKSVTPSLADSIHIRCRSDENMGFFPLATFSLNCMAGVYIRVSIKPSCLLLLLLKSVLTSLLREDIKFMMRGNFQTASSEGQVLVRPCVMTIRTCHFKSYRICSVYVTACTSECTCEKRSLPLTPVQCIISLNASAGY